MSEINSSLVSRCMDLTQHLVNEGTDFKFSLFLPSGFNFNFDLTQKKKMTSTKTPERKKLSPSTLKRNNLRKKVFLDKKAAEKETEKQLVGSPTKSPEITFKCNECEEKCISKESLEKHIDEKHNIAVNCKDCGHKSDSNDHLKEHIKEHHTIEQLDGVSKIQKSTKMIEHDKLLGGSMRLYCSVL